MFRFVPILALVLAVCAPLPGTGEAVATTVQQREPASPRTLERRARDAEPEKKAELLRLAAQRWVARGERRRAILALDEAIRAQPDDARLWRQRARLYAAAGANRTAIYDLSRAIELDATDLPAYRLRANLWRRLGAHDLAADDLARAAGEPQAAPSAAASPPSATDGAKLVLTPDALDAIKFPSTARATPAIRPTTPRSLLPSAEALAAGAAAVERAASAPRPARPALLEHPALDDITMAAARVHAAAGPAPAQIVSAQPLFPSPGGRGELPAAPDPIDVHRRRMEAAAIVQRRIEAGDAMMAAMNAANTAPASGFPDPNFRASTAPLPRIYRGTQVPVQVASKAAVARGTLPVAGVGGPHLPVRKAVPSGRQSRQTAASAPMTASLPRAQGLPPTAPASFDATPADPMIEHGVAVPVVRVERSASR